MRFLYTTAIRCYALGIRLAAFFGHAKAKQWVEGRRMLPESHPDDTQWVWVHAASLGEFEQGRPVIEALKADYPQLKILLSFFSPSGYEIRKDYPLADEVLYLPSDTPQHASQWMKRHHFVAAFFVKYEFWYNYIKALDDAGVPLFYISVLLQPDQYFFKWYGGWFRRQLHRVDHFFVQDEPTAALLHSIGIEQTTVCGDTRFDRVASMARQAKTYPVLERFIDGRECVVAGSTWPPDEHLLLRFAEKMPSTYCLVLAPHDISETHIAQIRRLIPSACLYTELQHSQQGNVLVLNTIGMLSEIYQYARFVYIGGGFGVNIHNIQEPVSFGCPVVFGPKYRRFKEASDLVALGGAFSVTGMEELDRIFALLMDDGFCAHASQTCCQYLGKQLGATDAIMEVFSSFFHKKC